MAGQILVPNRTVSPLQRKRAWFFPVSDRDSFFKVRMFFDTPCIQQYSPGYLKYTFGPGHSQ
jgi:hypothetical protein